MSGAERLSILGAKAKLASGELTSETLVRASLARIAAREGEVQAWAHLAAEQALAEAQASDAAGNPGLLGGIPVGIKDVFLTKDMPTEYNSPIYAGMRSGQDSAAVALLRHAGAILIGKTATVEFAATGRKAATRNPHDLGRTPGASSSGSAAAVGDFHVPMALGTQTGGSMIRPASFCGTWAMKPTWNVISNEGARRFAPTLDTVGWFTRSAEDLALVHQALSGEETGEASAKLRLALLRTPYWDRAEAPTRAAFDACAAALRRAGHEVEEAVLPAALPDLAAVHLRVMRGEGCASFRPEYLMAKDLLDPGIQELVENKDGLSPAELRLAQDQAAAARVAFDAFAQEFDAVLAPSTVGIAPEGLSFTGDLIFNGLWTLLHVPVVNIPMTDAESGLPVGLSLISGRGRDTELLAAAKAVSAAP